VGCFVDVEARPSDDPLEPEVGVSEDLLEGPNGVVLSASVSVPLLLVETKVNKVVRVAVTDELPDVTDMSLVGTILLIAVPDALVVALATMEALP